MTMSRKQKKNLIRIIVSLLLLAAAWIVTATLLPDLAHLEFADLRSALSGGGLRRASGRAGTEHPARPGISMKSS